MSITAYNATALTGGAVNSVDSYSVSVLNDNDRCFCVAGGALYYYMYEVNSTDDELSPDVIRPDDYVDHGIWRMTQSPLSEQHLLDHGAVDAAATIDCVNYNTHLMDCGSSASALTLTVSGLEIGATIAIVIDDGDNVASITWTDGGTSSFYWPEGTAPTYSTGIDRFVMQRVSSTIIHMAVAGQNFATV